MVRRLASFIIGAVAAATAAGALVVATGRAADEEKSVLADLISRALSTPATRVVVGRIEGALSSDATVHGIEISDRDGVLAQARSRAHCVAAPRTCASPARDRRARSEPPGDHAHARTGRDAGGRRRRAAAPRVAGQSGNQKIQPRRTQRRPAHPRDGSPDLRHWCCKPRQCFGRA